MLKKKSLSFPNAPAKKPLGLDLPGFVYFNLASDVRPKLDGCPIEVEFAKAGFPGWTSLSLEAKDRVVALLLDLDQVSRAEPLAILLNLELDFQAGFETRLEQLAEAWAMELETLQKLFKIVDDIGARISSFCPELLQEIVPWMAETACGHRHVIKEILGYSLLDDEWKDSASLLPYYGEVLTKAVMFADKSVGPDGPPEKFFGKIGNPTVHLALNQVRLIVNELIKLYGKPAQIVVELTRDLKMGQKAKSEFALMQKKNKARNDRAKVKLEELDRRLNYTNLLKMKLWEELTENGVGSHCIFTGKPISLRELFAPNSSVQIEHLLPFSRTYDDGISNKILCYQEANTLKGNRSPFEAFGNGRHEEKKYDWELIVKRAQGLPPNKRWRFQENAMELAEDDSWLERQLRDTAYLSRQTVLYLGAICSNVWSVPGRLTAFLRREWQMHPLLGDDKEKNRDDLRHHAIDAFVVGLTTRSLLQYVSKASAKGKPMAKELLDRHKSKDLLPLADLRDAFAARLDQMVVSFKPDHDVNKRFFKDTAYGVVHEEQGRSQNLVSRERVEALKSGAEKAIRDPLLASLFASKPNAKEAQDALTNQGVARVRTLTSNSSVERIPSAQYKAYALDGYAWCNVWLIPEKKPRVAGRYVTYLEAIRLEKNVLSANNLKPHPAAKKLMRLWKNDAIRLSSDQAGPVYRVVKFKATRNSIVIEPLNLTGEKDKYQDQKSLPSLIKQGLEKVTLNPLGREGHYVSRRRDLKSRGGSP
jgi:CRISPR-associated endonuclease Csn1